MIYNKLRPPVVMQVHLAFIPQLRTFVLSPLLTIWSLKVFLSIFTVRNRWSGHMYVV